MMRRGLGLDLKAFILIYQSLKVDADAYSSDLICGYGLIFWICVCHN